MHITLQRGESRQNFNIWVHGDEDLRRGSGLSVSHAGVATNHHFLLPTDGSGFTFHPGEYLVRVFAKRVGATRVEELALVKLAVTETHAEQLKKKYAGLYFDWGPDTQSYHGHVQIKPPQKLPYVLDDWPANSRPEASRQD